MWLKFTWLGPEIYSRYLVTLQWREGEDKVDALVNKLRICKDTVTALLCAHVSSMEIWLSMSEAWKRKLKRPTRS